MAGALKSKVRFYERRHQRQTQRKIAISPVPSPVRAITEKLGIEISGYAENATLL